MGKAWAPHTGDTKSAAGDALLGVYAAAEAATAAPASSSSVVATNLGKKCSIIQRISLMRMSSSE